MKFDSIPLFDADYYSPVVAAAGQCRRHFFTVLLLRFIGFIVHYSFYWVLPGFRFINLRFFFFTISCSANLSTLERVPCNIPCFIAVLWFKTATAKINQQQPLSFQSTLLYRVVSVIT